MGLLKQSTIRNRMFLMMDSTDHLTGKTGLTPAVTLSKNAAAFGAAAGAVTEIGSGWYNVALTAADTNTLGDLAVHATAAGADPSDWADEVSARITDDLSAPGTAQTITANQAVNVAQWNGSNVVAPATAGVPRVAIEAAGDFIQAAADKVWSSATRTLSAFSTALAQSVWDVLDANISVASSVGLRLKGLTFTTANKVDATIQAAGDFAQGAADKVWLTAARTLTAFGFSVTVGTNNDKTGYALSAAGVQAIWDALTSALTTVGSIGKLLVTNIDAAISSRSTYAGGDTAGTTTLLGRLTAPRATNLDNLDAAVSSRSTYAGADTAGTTTLLARVPGVVPVAADYTAARATKLDNLDATVSSRGTSTLTTADTIGADVKKINGTTVTGNGTSGTPWGP